MVEKMTQNTAAIDPVAAQAQHFCKHALPERRGGQSTRTGDAEGHGVVAEDVVDERDARDILVHLQAGPNKHQTPKHRAGKDGCVV